MLQLLSLGWGRVTLFSFLDCDVDVCLDGVKERIGKPRSDMPWVEDSEDAEFIEYIEAFDVTQKPMIAELLKRYTDKSLLVFKSRSEADEYLNTIK